MPGLAHQIGNGTATASFWSKHRDDVSYNQLQKYWTELSPQARQKLLKIDKQTLFEQARKNMYCSRCNGLLLEGFLQIVMYGKSLQQEGAGGHHACNGIKACKTQNDRDLCMRNGCQDDVQDPSVHPWGGLSTTRDGMLTLLDCYLYSNSLKGLQNVFDSARARERERELLYPDACGGGGRGWISQGMAGYGRGHGTRETCALHTARLSVDTLVDFWSALGEETRQSLLRMKEEDFIERLMYRFDSKRFCRDCRRNVIREFKELKELKRMRKEPRCTSWFCVADTSFQYEVSHDTVQADWHRTFIDSFGTYHHFEWAIGTGEGKSDILEFENVGLSVRVQVTGLDLGGLNACYITLRAWKTDGRCTELSVKAHALRGQQCVHCRLVVGDGFVTITRGESIRRFFEHAEEAEEDEDDESMDKDGNELDGECSRPQKHAKSPELAREFLLDAATVIFKEQVEKAFREGTARQNAHSIFVGLALKLLEERVHVACKEIITLEKQMKLLEEEEKEKREEEERKERKRNKEREKKLRRKERLREKEKDKDKKGSESNEHPSVLNGSKDTSTPSNDEEPLVTSNRDASEVGESIPSSPDIEDDQLLDDFTDSNMQDHSDDSPDVDFACMKDGDESITIDKLKFSCRKLKFQKEFHQDSNLQWPDRRRFPLVSETRSRLSKHEQRHHGDNFGTSRNVNGLYKQVRSNVVNSSVSNGGPKFGEKFHCSNIRMSDRYDSHACSCNQQNEYKAKLESQTTKVVRDSKSVSKPEPTADMSKPYYRGNKYNQVEYIRENCGRLKSKTISSNNPFNRDTTNTRKVWEPMESQKKYPRSNSDCDVTSRSSAFKVEGIESDQHHHSSDANRSEKVTGDVEVNQEVKDLEDLRESTPGADGNRQNGFHLSAKHQYMKEVTDEESVCSATISFGGTSDLSVSCSSNSDNCSSCLSEGDSNSSSTNPQNIESTSTSDSEDASQNSEGRANSPCPQTVFSSCHEILEKRQSAVEEQHFRNQMSDSTGSNSVGNLPAAANLDNGWVNVGVGAQSQIVLPPLHNQSIQFPMFQAPSGSYYHQSPISWPAAPTNGLMPFPHPNQYIFPSPFGYGLNGNTHFMQYGALQHSTPPQLNHGHFPAIQPIAQTNGINLREHAKITNPGVLKESHHESSPPKVVPSGEHPREAPKTVETGQNGKSKNSGAESTSFSLFHFGGPIALSTGFKSDPVSLKEKITGGMSSTLSADHTQGDQECNKKNCIEEYNLFAASNGIKFSFF